MKGAISLVMLHMIPRDFEYLDLFEAIVVGNVLLSTFVYPFFLVIVIKIYKNTFKTEYENEHRVN